MFLKNYRYDYINTAILFGKLTAMLTYILWIKKGGLSVFSDFQRVTFQVEESVFHSSYFPASLYIRACLC